MSLGENQGKRIQGERVSSDSESSAMDETPDSFQDGVSSLESQSSSSAAADIAAAPSEDKHAVQSDKTIKQSDVAPDNHLEGESNVQKSTQAQTVKATPTDTSTNPKSEDNKSKTQLGSGKGTRSTNHKEPQKTEHKNSKANKDTDTTKQPSIDQNANVDPNVKQTGQTKQKGKNQQEQKQKPTMPTGQMVFGPQTQSKVMMEHS